MRPAQIGDICVLLEPTDPHEIKQLRQRQAALQARFGGQPIENVHLSCQRFACQDEGLLGAFVQNLSRVLADLEPFPLAAIALKPHYTSIRQTNVLKWEIRVTQELEGFVSGVGQALLAAGIAPLFRSGFVSSLVSALKDIPEPEPVDLTAEVFPQHLFAAGRVVLSRIHGPNVFEVLAELRLTAMPKPNIIDTFPAFLDFWAAAQGQPVDAQIEAWASDYMSAWPELLGKQQDDYASQGEDWRQIARERVFLFLDDRLPAMRVAHAHLLQACPPIFAAAREALGFQCDVLFLIYVGIGCGAGWATRYAGSPAVLFGLENVAECGWTELGTISGLVAHEIGHLAHDHWRARHARPEGSGPWWQLYCEGFAQRCEHVILGRESWHMQGSGDESARTGGWLAWCRDRERWLATLFLETVDAGESVRTFFGSWYDIHGRSQCGYYLGHQLIKQLEAELSLKEIALLDPDDGRLRRELERIADDLTFDEL